MKAFNFLVFKTFCLGIIEQEKWGPEVAVVLLDVGMNPIYGMTVRKNEVGEYVFEKEGPMQESVHSPGPYRVRFTVGGTTSLRDYPTT